MNTNTATEYVRHYLDQYDKGDEEDWFHGLIESPYDIFDILNEAFKKETDETKQSFILDVISHFQDKRSYDLLKTALATDKTKVWKSALDGLVGLSDSQAVIIIKDVCGEKKDEIFQEWAKEAIQQIEDKNAPISDAENTDTVSGTFIGKQKEPSKIDAVTWLCFWICLSVPLFVFNPLITEPISHLVPLLFWVATVFGVFRFVKLVISKRDMKEKVINGLLILVGLLIGPALSIVLIIFIGTHLNFKLG